MANHSGGRVRARRPGVEGLESRRLPSVYISSVGSNSQYLASITSGPDGQIWFTTVAGFPTRMGDVYASVVGSVDPTTHAVREVLLSRGGPGAGVNGIATGPDGNVWFTDPGSGSKIGSINPTTFAVTEYTLPAGSSGLAFDARGDLWFTEPALGEIGEFNTTTHAITQYPLPDLNSEPTGMTLGPDGNIWFTMTGTSQVGSIDPTTHAIEVFSTPSARADPQQIIAGPDGNLWFSEAFNGVPGSFKIGEIDPTTHATSDYAANADSGLAVGPDGNIWFTGLGAVGEIDPTTHAVAEYPLPYVDTAPKSLVTGPDGNVWINDTGGFSIAYPIPAGQSVIASDVQAGPIPSLSPPALPDPLAGRTVYLDLKGTGTLQPGDPTATTDASGNYAFFGLAPGTYTVRVVAYPGDRVIAPAGGAQSVTTTGGRVSTPATFAVARTSAIMPLHVVPDPFGSANPDVSTAEVVGLYRAILGRAPDPAGLAFYVGLLRGGRATVGRVATDMLTSPEYESDVVASDYRTFLGRAGAPSEVAAWVASMQSTGLTAEQVAYDCLTSPEFNADHPGDGSFLRALYGDLLGRPAAPSEVSAWESMMDSGLSRAAVVADAFHSPEAESRAIEGFDAVFLARRHDYGFDGVGMLGGGASLAATAATYAGSVEFAQRANATVA